MTLRIKNKYVLSLARWLANLSLSGQESRNRTKFVEALSEQEKENEEMRLEILKKYAEVDEETKELKMVEENGAKHYVIPDEDTAKFTKEFTDYIDQDFIMEGEGLKTRLTMVSSIVLNTTEKIVPELATDYDKWCEAFEAMLAENK